MLVPQVWLLGDVAAAATLGYLHHAIFSLLGHARLFKDLGRSSGSIGTNHVIQFLLIEAQYKYHTLDLVHKLSITQLGTL